MTPTRLKVIQAIGEAVIPLLGFFYFDWSLYFILLFYFIDLIATEVFTYIKVNKIITFQRIGYTFQQRYGKLIINTSLVLLLLILSHLFIYFQQSGINFWKAFAEFLAYEEPGFPVPQGYILLPLVIFGNYQQYNSMFVKSNAYRVFSWKKLILSRRRALFISLSGALLGLILVQLLVIPSLIYLLLITVIKFYVDVKLTL
jgi:hypothetical protein